LKSYRKELILHPRTKPCSERTSKNFKLIASLSGKGVFNISNCLAEFHNSELERYVRFCSLALNTISLSYALIK
jgi:hypothetical protein